MKLFYFTFYTDAVCTAQGITKPEGADRNGWFTVEAGWESDAVNAMKKLGSYAHVYTDENFRKEDFFKGELKRFKASDILNPPPAVSTPDSAAPLTTEQLCRNLLAIKPGEAFECRRVLDSAPYGRDEWTGLHEFPDAVWAVREGYDVRPLPRKRFVLLYHSPPDRGVPYDSTAEVHGVERYDGSKFYLITRVVEAPSLTAAAALAAPQPGETFLAAVPYPEAQ